MAILLNITPFKKMQEIRKTASLTLTIIFISVLISVNANADSGMISVQPLHIELMQILIYEPEQKAIISWNGTEEVLILSTSAYAQNNTSVLQIIPLPSNPNINLGNFSSFYEIDELIKNRTYLSQNSSSQNISSNYHDGKTYLNLNESIEIVFQKKIGIHNLTVIHFTSIENYTDWITNFLTEKNTSNEILPSNLNSIINDYLQRNISYFVFDELELTTTTWSIEPMIYRFSINYLYYPLQISSISHGNTTITLFCMTDKNVNWTSGENLEFERKIEFNLNESELSNIETNISEMFSNNSRLYVYKYEGTLQLNEDFYVKEIIDNSSEQITIREIASEQKSNNSSNENPQQILNNSSEEKSDVLSDELERNIIDEQKTSVNSSKKPNLIISTEKFYLWTIFISVICLDIMIYLPLINQMRNHKRKQ